MDKESACQCRGHGFSPWSRKIPRASEELSPCATPTEALEELPQREGTAARRPHTTSRGEPPLVETRESPRGARKTSAAEDN